MNIAYLITVHRNPKLLERAINVLSYEDSGFFIHVDRKVDASAFDHISGPKVFFTARLPVYWAEFSTVEAEILLMRYALSSPVKYDYFVMLQGSDYPLRSGAYIAQFLKRGHGAEFINLVKMPAPGFPLSKINTIRYPSNKPVLCFATRVMAKFDLAIRDHNKYLKGLRPYAGNAQWALSREAVEYMIRFSDSNPYLKTYFRYTLSPEEMLFHTILGNSAFCDRTRRSLMFVDWSRGPHPRMLGHKHLEIFEGQDRVILDDEWGPGEVLFARKFSDDNLHLIDRIDRMIIQKDEAVTIQGSAA